MPRIVLGQAIYILEMREQRLFFSGTKMLFKGHKAVVTWNVEWHHWQDLQNGQGKDMENSDSLKFFSYEEIRS